MRAKVTGVKRKKQLWFNCKSFDLQLVTVVQIFWVTVQLTQRAELDELINKFSRTGLGIPSFKEALMFETWF